MEYNPTDIYTERDLQRMTTNNSVNGDVVIRGEHLRTLGSIEVVNGFLGISDAALESLGNLSIITDDFWTSFHTVYSPLRSLGKLEKIGGDASFRYSNIVDLGELKYVGGKLSLRDTPISNLGQLQFVGGDLYLPKRLKDTIDLTNVHVVGKIQYWNDSKTRKRISEKASFGLEKSELAIPYWPHEYIYSVEDLADATPNQKKFYAYFKKSFLNGVFIDISGNDNYVFILYYDLFEEYDEHGDIGLLQQQCENLSKYYPKTANYISLSIIEEFEKREDFESAWEVLKLREYLSVHTVWEYERKLNKKLLDGDIMLRLSGSSHLTDFGKKNIEAIKLLAEKSLRTYEAEKSTSFFDLVIDSKKQYNASKESAILKELRLITRNAEDLYRVENGMPKIGEGWISETELFYKIQEAFSEYEVVHQGSTSWLGRQRIDIYFPQLNIGIEYQGLQHYEPVEFFGGQNALEKNIERDEKKRKLCEANECILIYVNEGYDFSKLALEIGEHIKMVNGKTLMRGSKGRP